MVWWLTAAGRIAHALTLASERRVNAQTEEARIAADIEIEMLKNRSASLVAGSDVTKWVQALYAAPFILYLWKLVVWDKILASYTQGVTDPLGPFETNIGTIVVGFYFLTTAGQALLRRR